MKWFLLGAMVTLTAVGCNNVEVALLVEEVPPPDDEDCSLEPGNVDFPLTFDSQNMSSMLVPTEVTSILSESDTTIVLAEPEITQQFPNTVTPLRFDFRWECDSFGFTAGQGPLILPAFSVDNPFCLDTRDDANNDFAGFDVVSASGAPVSPGSTAIWTFTPITAQLGIAIAEAFRFAELSEACCDSAPGGDCNNVASVATLGACQELQDALNAVAPNRFNVQDVNTLNIWRPYIAYTLQGTLAVGNTNVASFPLRLRGVYEGITARGSLITSAEFVRNVGVCKGDIVNGINGGPCTGPTTIRCLQE